MGGAHHEQQDLDIQSIQTPALVDSDDDADKSPESAAVARGAARTAASAGGKSATTATAATKGAIAGRLPIASRSAAKKVAAPRIPSRPLPKVVARTGGGGRAPRSIPRAAAPRTVPKAQPRVRAPRRVVHKPPASARSVPKLSSRVPKARAITIAKASDRASKGFDVLSAGLEQNQSAADPTSQPQSEKSKAQALPRAVTRGLQQIASFGKIFGINTILGMAVFETYEGVIEYIAPPLKQEDGVDHVAYTRDIPHNSVATSDKEDDCNNIVSSQPIDDNQNSIGEYQMDAMDRATLPQHFMAGALGGAAHAVLSLALEIKLSVSGNILHSDITSGRMTNYTFTNNALAPKYVNLQLPALNYSASSILHHSLAHFVLFGSYQSTKRLLLQDFLCPTNNISPSGSNDAAHIASIAIAGGLAGQCQYVTSHFSEQWLALADDMAIMNSSAPPLLRRMALTSWPTWRSTILAFPPSAIGFLAFEYGKFLITGSGDDLANR